MCTGSARGATVERNNPGDSLRPAPEMAASNTLALAGSAAPSHLKKGNHEYFTRGREVAPCDSARKSAGTKGGCDGRLVGTGHRG